MRFRNLVTICVLAVTGCFAIQSFGQTITTGIVPTNLCPGDSVIIPFTTTGTFQAKNFFTAQLSNSNGDFDSAFVTLAQTNNSAATSIAAAIPAGTTAGTHYRIRVISGKPYVAGSDNGSDIAIGAFPDYVAFAISQNGCLVGESVTFSNNSRGGVSYLWNFGDGAVPPTSTSSKPGSVTYTTPGAKTITLTATSSTGCSQTITNQYIFGAFNVYTCNPAIPHSASIDSTTAERLGSDTIWVVDGGNLTVGGAQNQVIFVEAGGNVDFQDGVNISIFLKAGATLTTEYPAQSNVIYEEGAGITQNNQNSVTLLKCNPLSFDYTNAPPYHLTGVHEDVTAPMNIALYPNPANDMLHVFTGVAMPSAVRLFNALGEEVWSAAGHLTNNVQIPTYALQNGVYYLQVTAPGKISTEKVTVIH